jgi:hypothetical protein
VPAPITLVFSNLAPGEHAFTCEWASWNVTRAARDCAKGMYELYPITVADALAANREITVDEAKIAAMLADRPRLMRAPPLIFVFEQGRIWLIDGHHRLHAMSRAGYPECAGYVIPEEASRRYQIFFNGDRRPTPEAFRLLTGRRA